MVSYYVTKKMWVYLVLSLALCGLAQGSMLKEASHALGIPEEAARSTFANMISSHFTESPVKPTAPGIDVTCGLCLTILEGFFKYMEDGETDEQLMERATSVCIDMGLYPEEVCRGAVSTQGPVVCSVIRNVNHTVIADELCTMLSGDWCREGYDVEAWVVKLPDTPKPPVEEVVLPADGGATMKYLHLTDIHLAAMYRESGQAECDLPMCCEKEWESGAKAGKWGCYSSCDTPLYTFENLLRHVKETHKDLDAVLMTGDIPAHDIWKQTREANNNISKYLIDTISEILPGIPVYPTTGNHEPHPLNCLHHDEAENAWQYEKLKGWWHDKEWVDKETVAPGLCYKKQIAPGLRLLSLNSVYGYQDNWWSYLEVADPGGVLTWLVDELQAAEDAGDKVHIITHHPTGSSTRYVWSRNLNRILNRYENIVRGYWYGHTHHDDFQLMFDSEEKDRCYSIHYNSPSVTTYSDLNPAYKIYTIDGQRTDSTWMVLNSETWMMNLTEANAGADPEWTKMYDLKAEYTTLQSLLPQHWYQWVKKAVTDAESFAPWYKYRDIMGPNQSACDTAGCRRSYLCGIVSADTSDRWQCNNLPQP